MENNPAVELVIFDYDGVLVDSVSQNSAAFIQVFADFGYKIKIEDFIVGNSLKEQFQYVLDKYELKISYQKFKKEFEKLVKKKKADLYLRQEFTSLIKSLSSEFLLAIASNNSKNRIIKVLS